MVDSHTKITLGLLSGLSGAIIGWSANALTMGGRVAALEATTARIEAMVVVLLRDAPAKPTKPMLLEGV